MNRKPLLFNAENAYRLIWEIAKAVDLEMPYTLIPRNTRFAATSHNHVDVWIIRKDDDTKPVKAVPKKSNIVEKPVEDPQIPQLVFMTKPSNSVRGPQPLVTLFFTEADIGHKIHEHIVVGTMEIPTDYSMLNALKLVDDMQKAADTFIYEELGVTSFHEVWGPIQQRYRKRIDNIRHIVNELLAKSI